MGEKQMRKPTLKERAIILGMIEKENEFLRRGLTTKEESRDRIMRTLWGRQLHLHPSLRQLEVHWCSQSKLSTNPSNISFKSSSDIAISL